VTAKLKSTKQLTAQFQASAMDVRKDNKKAISDAAQVVKKIGLVELGRATGGDGRLSHWGWSPRTKRYRAPQMGIGYKVVGQVDAVAYIKARPYGLWRFLESGGPGRDYVILARKKSRRQNAKRGTLSLNGDFRERVPHPNQRPKHTWSRTIDRSRGPALEMYRRRMLSTTLDRFH
jgi:hypothetical protein